MNDKWNKLKLFNMYRSIKPNLHSTVINVIPILYINDTVGVFIVKWCNRMWGTNDWSVSRDFPVEQAEAILMKLWFLSDRIYYAIDEYPF